MPSRSPLESGTKEGDSPVGVGRRDEVGIPSMRDWKFLQKAGANDSQP